jgi:hypothetical protein
VSWAASLDARPALPARLATLVAVGASSASNGAWAYLRTRHDLVSVALGMAVPIAANLAFEVLLAELRRQVQRRRGLSAPVAIPYPRMIRFVLAPWSTFRVWRLMVLELTAIDDTTAIPVDTLPGSSEPIASEPDEEVKSEQDTGSRSSILSPLLASIPAATSSQPGVPRRSPSSVSWAAPKDPVPTRVATATHKPLADRAADQHSISAPTRSSTSSFDPRAVALAQQLATMDEADQVTGSRVGPLLGLDIAPRTGRRLLGQARQLLNGYEPASDESPSQPLLAAHR